MVECLPMDWETGVQSQVESYPRLKKWYLIPPCLTLSIIRYVSRVKWSNPGKGVVPSPIPRCSSYWKGSFWVAPEYSCQLYFYFTSNYNLSVELQLLAKKIFHYVGFIIHSREGQISGKTKSLVLEGKIR